MANPARDLLSLLTSGLTGESAGARAEEIQRLSGLIVRSLHLVDKGANRQRLLIAKNDGGEPMAGAEIKANEDGTLSALEALAKAALMMDPKDKAMCIKVLEGMLAKVKGATEKAGAKAPAELASAAKMLYTKLSGGGGYPPAKEDTDMADKDDVDKKKAKKADDDPDSVELDGDVFTGPLAVIAKRGKKMSSENLAKFKKHLMGLQKLADEADGDEAGKIANVIEGAFAKLAKRDGENADTQNALLGQLLEAVTGKPIAKKDDSLGGGQAADENNDAARKKVAKKDEGEEGWDWLNADINDPELHRDTADPETSFFDEKEKQD